MTIKSLSQIELPVDPATAFEAATKQYVDNKDNTLVPTTRQIVAGAGLTGGGTLSTDRTLDIGAGTGITVAADSVALDTSYTDTRYVNATGDTMSGDLTISKGTTPTFTLSATDSTNPSIQYSNNGIARWAIQPANAEGGGNTGFDLIVKARTDAGAANFNVFTMNRSTGLVTVAADPQANLGISTKQYADAKIPKSLVDAKGDLLVGTANDTVARIAAGTNGQVLTVDSAQTEGVKWATPLDQTTADGRYVNVTGDTMSGSLSITAATGNIPIYQLALNGVARWNIGTDGATESGSNTGTNFRISALNDSGVSPIAALDINRQTGLASVVGDPTANLGIATKQYVDGKTGVLTSLDYSFNITTTAPPGSGQLRLNNATQTSATSMYVHYFTAPGVDAKLIWTKTVYLGDTIVLQDKDDSTKYQRYTVSSSPVDNTTYATIGLTWVEGGSSLTASRIMVFVKNTNTPAGAAGGDLTGTYPNPTLAVDRVRTTLIDAKGDLIVGTADNTVGRLPVGTNNYVLTADSTQASGMKWAAATGGGGGLDQATADTLYVNVTGDTMTGSLNMDTHSVTISDGTNTAQLRYGWTEPFGSGAALSSDGSIFLVTDGYINALGSHASIGTWNNTGLNFNDSTGLVNLFATNFSVGGIKIEDVGTPTVDTDAATKLYADGKVAKTGDTMSGTLNVGSAITIDPTYINFDSVPIYISETNILMQSAAPSNKYIRYLVAGKDRFGFGVTGTPETGGNTGSHFVVARYADDGTWLNNPIQINRDSGRLVLDNAEFLSTPVSDADFNMNDHYIFNLHDPNSSQDAATKNYVDSTRVAKTGDTMTGDLTITGSGPSLNLNSPTPALRGLNIQTNGITRWVFGAEGGNNFVFSRWDTSGEWIDNPMDINISNGLVSIGKPLWLGDPVPTASNHAASKQYVDARTPKITVATSAPGSPATNDVWIDSS